MWQHRPCSECRQYDLHLSAIPSFDATLKRRWWGSKKVVPGVVWLCDSCLGMPKRQHHPPAKRRKSKGYVNRRV